MTQSAISSYPPMRSIFLALAFALASGYGAAPAWAHAELELAEPRVGNSVARAPREVVLHFSEELLPDESEGQVFDAFERRVDLGGLVIDEGDPKIARVKLQKIGPGDYAVHWKARTDDTATQGRFMFTVTPGPAIQMRN